MSHIATVTVWWLLVWPDPTQCRIIQAEYPPAITHRQSHETMADCWKLRDEFEARNMPAFCKHVGLRQGYSFRWHKEGAGFIHLDFSGHTRSTIAKPHRILDGDKICVFPPAFVE